MKTEDFLRALNASRILPEPVMQKLQAKLEKTDKNISPRSVAKYLIDTGFLSRYQAKQLLAGELTPADDLDLKVPAEQSQDTDELLGDLKAPPPEAPPVAPPDVTRHDPVPGRFDDEIEVVNVEHEMTMQQGLNPQVPDAGQIDPLGGFGLDDPESPVEEVVPGGSFAGKKSRSNQWESKWLFIGFGLLGFFILAGIILAVTLFKTDASKMWEDAVNDFNNGNYSAALPKLLNYIDDYPGDDKHPDALVKIANCKLRVPYDSRNWGNTLSLAQEVLPGLSEDLEEIEEAPKFDGIRPELSVILPGTALGFTEVAIEAPDVPTKQAQLDLALQARDLIDQSAYVPTSYKRNPGVNKVLTDVNDNIAIVERQIQMENDYAQALQDIAGLTDQGRTTEAFETYDDLTNLYPSLKIRDELRKAKAGISDREADLVTTVDSGVTQATVDPTPVTDTIVLGTRSGQPQIPGIGDRMLVHLINGALYGIRASTGEIVWRKYVGIDTTTQPLWIGEQGQDGLIAVDSRRHQLMRIDAATGDEAWRVAIGEPFSVPNVSADRILLAARSGKVMVIDPDTGQSGQAGQLPQPADVSPATISQAPLLYQPGHESSLYVLSMEDMDCREVYFLDHRPGSVVIPPFVMNDHLIVAENGADYCKLHVLRPTENGLGLERAQPSIRLDGQVTEPIVNYGRWGLVVSDEGDMRMLELNKGNEVEPVTVVVSKSYSPTRPTRKFLLANNGQLWNAAAGLRRYKIQKAAGDFKEERVKNNLDTFIAPPMLINDTLFHVRRRHDSALVSVSAVDAGSLEEVWRNDFAAPLAGVARLGDSRPVAVNSQGDVFELNEDNLQAGVLNSPFTRGSNVMQTLVFDNVLQFRDDMFVVTGPAERKSIVAVDPTRDPPSRLSDFRKPADKPACRPVRFGDYLLVAALRGQVFRIDPQSGLPVGAPFQPELQPNVDVYWREPAVLDPGQSFVIGNANGDFFLVVADGMKSLSRLDQLVHDAPLLSPLIAVGGNAVGVCRGDTDYLVAVGGNPKLEIRHRMDLPGGYVSGPVPLNDGHFLVILDTGVALCLDDQLNQVWQADVGADKLAGPPVTIDGQLYLAFESGKLVAIDPDSGDVGNTLELGQPVSGGPVEIGGVWLVPGNDGTLHRIDQLSNR